MSAIFIDEPKLEDSSFSTMSVSFYQTTPNFLDEWLILLLRIQEVLGSNLVPDTSHPKFSHSFFSLSRRMMGYYLKKAKTANFKILVNSSFTYNLFRSCIL
jgi:hypothetical protein